MHLKTLLSAAAAAVLISLSALSVEAAPEPQDPKKQTPWRLYLTSQEAYDMKQKMGDKVLFVDVREPIEMMFTGFTDVVDANVPYLMVNPAKWNPKKPKFAMEKNEHYAADIEAAMTKAGLTKKDPLILMCRSGGTRGAPSANALQGLGYEKVYVVVDGFEGSKQKNNPKGPWRLKNGWKNAGLPWSYNLNPDKVYKRAASLAQCAAQ